MSAMGDCTTGRWSVHTDDATGARYYTNSVTKETRWSLEIGAHPLPEGWTEHADASSGCAYYHHRESDTTTFDHPGFILHQGGAEESGLGRLDPTSGAAAISARHKGVARPVPTVVRWKFVKHGTVSLAHALLECGDDEGRAEGGTGSSDFRSGSNAHTTEQDSEVGRARTPSYLQQLFRKIFRVADRDGSGSLTTLDLTTMLQARAKGTALSGDAHAIFTLHTLLSEQAEHGEIRVEEFEHGLMCALAKEKNEATAQWILNELMDEAVLWTEQTSDEGQLYWAHTEGEVETTWVKPAVLTALARVKSATSC